MANGNILYVRQFLQSA